MDSFEVAQHSNINSKNKDNPFFSVHWGIIYIRKYTVNFPEKGIIVSNSYIACSSSDTKCVIYELLHVPLALEGPSLLILPDRMKRKLPGAINGKLRMGNW